MKLCITVVKLANHRQALIVLLHDMVYSFIVPVVR